MRWNIFATAQKELFHQQNRCIFIWKRLVFGYIRPKRLRNNRFHSSTKLTPIQASLEENEGFVNKNSLEKRKKIKPKYKIGDLVTTADLKKTFSKSDTTNWSNKLNEITEIVDETIPGYKKDVLKKRYIESWLKKHC